MKRLTQVVAAVVTILVISSILTRAESASNLPADIQRAVASPHGTSFPPQASSSEILPPTKAEPNLPQEPESPESRFEAARIRYRNIAQGLLSSLADWEQRVQETIRKLERFQADWESSAGLGKNKETGEPNIGNRTGQETTVVGDQSLLASKTSTNGGLSKPATTNISSDKISDVSRNAIAPANLDLQEPDKNKQAEDLACQCEQLAEQLLKVAKQIRAKSSNQE